MTKRLCAIVLVAILGGCGDDDSTTADGSTAADGSTIDSSTIAVDARPADARPADAATANTCASAANPCTVAVGMDRFNDGSAAGTAFYFTFTPTTSAAFRISSNTTPGLNLVTAFSATATDYTFTCGATGAVCGVSASTSGLNTPVLTANQTYRVRLDRGTATSWRITILPL